MCVAAVKGLRPQASPVGPGWLTGTRSIRGGPRASDDMGRWARCCATEAGGVLQSSPRGKWAPSQAGAGAWGRPWAAGQLPACVHGSCTHSPGHHLSHRVGRRGLGSGPPLAPPCSNLLTERGWMPAPVPPTMSPHHALISGWLRGPALWPEMPLDTLPATTWPSAKQPSGDPGARGRRGPLTSQEPNPRNGTRNECPKGGRCEFLSPGITRGRGCIYSGSDRA